MTKNNKNEKEHLLKEVLRLFEEISQGNTSGSEESAPSLEERLSSLDASSLFNQRNNMILGMTQEEFRARTRCTRIVTERRKIKRKPTI